MPGQSRPRRTTPSPGDCPSDGVPASAGARPGEGGPSSGKSAFGTGIVVLVWFALNIAISSVTKWVYTYGVICVGGTCWHFQYPYWMTALHMVMSWALCAFYISWVRPAAAHTTMTARQLATQVLPLAACFAFSAGFNNVSLKYIFPSLNQMLGASTAVFTVLLSTLILGAYYNVWAWVSMLIICTGVTICAGFEGNFSSFGMCCCLLSAVLRGARSVLAEKVLSGDMRQQLDSVSLLYYMAPMSAVLMVCMAFVYEGLTPLLLLFMPQLASPDGRLSWERYIHSVSTAGESSPVPPITGVSWTMLLLGISGLNACLLNIFNFLVTAHTSAVSFQVLGQAKTCVSIIASVAIFHNRFTVHQGGGVAICLLGVWLYQAKGAKMPAPCPQKSSLQEGMLEAGHAETEPLLKRGKPNY